MREKSSKNFLGNNPEWFWVMKKIATPLGMSAFPVGTKLTLKDWEYPIYFQSYWYHYEDVYADKQEVEAIKRYLYYLIENDPNYPDRMARKINNLVNEIKNQKINFKNSVSLSELLKIFEKESDLFMRIVGMLSYRGPVQIADILDEKVLSILMFNLSKKGKINLFEYYREFVRAPANKSIVLEEHEFIIKNKDNLKENEDKVLKEYKSKFGFLSFHLFIGKELTDKEVLDRFFQKISEHETEKKLVLTEILDEKEIKLVKQLQEWIFLRTFIKDMVNLASYKLQPLLSTIAEKKGIPYEYLPFLTYPEILDLEIFSIEEIKKKYLERINGYSAQIKNDKLIIGDFGDPPKIGEETTILKGEIAFKGKVTGKVKILKSPKDNM